MFMSLLFLASHWSDFDQLISLYYCARARCNEEEPSSTITCLMISDCLVSCMPRVLMICKRDNFFYICLVRPR